MAESAILIGVFKLLLALVGILAARFALSWFDRLLVKSRPDSLFAQWWASASPAERGVYLSARFVGVCLLVGLVL